MKNIIVYLSLVLILVSCNKDEVDPIGFTPVQYTTQPDESQIFNYFYDDGKFVAGGLDQYIASLRTQQGTFSKEQLLLMTFRTSEEIFADSIIPYTYTLGTNYIDTTQKEVEYRINLEYPYDNIAHRTYSEDLFFKSHLDEMRLYKIKTEANGSFYYDPDILMSEVPYTIDYVAGEVVFSTYDIHSAYALCWVEKVWHDSIYVQFTDNTYSNTINIVEGGRGKRNVDAVEGAIFQNNHLQMQYTEEEQESYSHTSDDGWMLNDLYITISNPKKGMVSLSDLNFSLLISNNNIKTHLKPNQLTNIEIIEWPAYGKYGKIRFSGRMLIEAYQRNISVNMEISFKRQR